ncbi:DUF397 domain-containing protein [Nocardia sp. NBC_01503]|uniref:DUF397 domain-containing protein n=1 Tax=Nocardia sp. NBC_01503 TaxID=2975997 RepID=UPI002E7B83E0|nr:DUF397 domain-containing protein [Nocardia sp. NBC_01503]WTL35298.1 DUF397 domain-containing protein [Nocardia sp. NBC_01503]
MNNQPPVRQWYKSSRSSNANDCVEVYQDDTRVGVRDSKLGTASPVLVFDGFAWDRFNDAVKSGRFDRP